MRRQITFVVGIVALAVAGAVYTLASGNEPLLGLDLQGGASVVLEPTEPTSDDDLDVAVEIIRNRVDGLGVAEPEITTQGGNILVQLPGVDDQQRALDLVGQTAELRFRPVIDSIDEATYQAAVTLLEEGPVEEEPAEAPADDTADPEEPPVEEPADPTEDPADDVADPTEPADDVADPTEPAEDPVDDPADPAEPAEEPVDDPADPAEEPVEEAPDPVELARQTVDEFTFTGDVEASDNAVVPQYDEDRNVILRYVLGPTEVTGDFLEGANALTRGIGGWFVNVTFRSGESGIDAFNELGQRCHSSDPTCRTRQVAIEIDNEVESAPVVQADNAVYAPFNRSEVQISGGGNAGFSERDAKDLALVLDYGALPVELEAQESRVVSSTLGDDALDAGITAGLIGLALVSIYLLAYYRLLGMVAILSLAISGVFLWTIIAWIGESQGLALTLAGVTGLIVSVGVSVDSNVVYFEHLKEDVRGGRTLRSAVDRAFPIAFSTIVKADVASLIAAGVLWWLTVGQVRGFALFLGLATVLDLVATYFFMGPAIRLLAARSGLYAHPTRFGIPATAEAAS